MVLEKGQIDTVGVWLHPEWEIPCSENLIEMEINRHLFLIDALRKMHRVALIRIPSMISIPASTSLNRTFRQQMRRVDEYAENAIGDRYIVWNDGLCFIDMNFAPHKQRLIDDLNLDESEHRMPLKEIFTFGKLVGECPEFQARDFNMQTIVSDRVVCMPLITAHMVSSSHDTINIPPECISYSWNAS